MKPLSLPILFKSLFLDKYRRAIAQHGRLSTLLIPLFPFILLFSNSVRLLKTIYFSKVLFNGQWTHFSNYRPWNGINGLFYWNMSLNIDRYGKSGISTEMADGSYPMSKLWHLSLPSLYLYWKISALFPLLLASSVLILCLNFYTVFDLDPLFSFCALLLLFVSSYFYSSAFVVSNYNLIGWLIFPFALLSLLTGNFVLTALLWLLASMGSITVVFIGIFFCLTFTIYSFSFIPIITIIPASLKILSHFLYDNDPITSLKNLLSAIGFFQFNKKQIKYTRLNQWRRLFALDSRYVIITWSIFAYCLYALHPINSLSLFLVLTSLFLWLLNSTVLRFADQTSLYNMMFWVSFCCVLFSNSYLMLLPFWIVISPLPFIISSSSVRDQLYFPQAYKPFRVQYFIDKCTDFLHVIPQSSRVLLCVGNPNNNYDNIFDGYRVTYELLFYSASLNYINIFPDWWYVFDNNTHTSFNVWANEPREVIDVLSSTNSNYCVITQDSLTRLDSKWPDSNFEVCATLDWLDFQKYFGFSDEPWLHNLKYPKWFLLRFK